MDSLPKSAEVSKFFSLIAGYSTYGVVLQHPYKIGKDALKIPCVNSELTRIVFALPVVNSSLKSSGNLYIFLQQFFLSTKRSLSGKWQ